MTALSVCLLALLIISILGSDSYSKTTIANESQYSSHIEEKVEELKDSLEDSTEIFNYKEEYLDSKIDYSFEYTDTTKNTVTQTYYNLKDLVLSDMFLLEQIDLYYNNLPVDSDLINTLNINSGYITSSSNLYERDRAKWEKRDSIRVEDNKVIMVSDGEKSLVLNLKPFSNELNLKDSSLIFDGNTVTFNTKEKENKLELLDNNAKVELNMSNNVISLNSIPLKMTFTSNNKVYRNYNVKIKCKRDKTTLFNKTIKIKKLGQITQ